MLNHWEKIVLGAAALVMLICLFLGFRAISHKPDPLPPISTANQMPASVVPVAESTMETLGTPSRWSSPKISSSGNSLNLFISRPALVSVENPDPASPILMDEPDPMLHPPVPNAWFLKYNLPYLQADVLDQDQDKDGFTNLEEYQGDTDPTDDTGRPAVTAKLALEDLKTSSRFFNFNLLNGERVGIQGGVMQGNNFRRVWSDFVEPGGLIGPPDDKDRYELLAIVPGSDGSAELRDTTLPEDARNARFTLPYRQVDSVDEYTAVFIFTLNEPSGEIIEVPERGEFQLPGVDGQRFRLKSIDEDSMTALVEELNPADEVIDELTIGSDGPQ